MHKFFSSWATNGGHYLTGDDRAVYLVSYVQHWGSAVAKRDTGNGGKWNGEETFEKIDTTPIATYVLDFDACFERLYAALKFVVYTNTKGGYHCSRKRRLFL